MRWNSAPTRLTIGVLFSMYSVFPVFLSLYAGKLSDRFGCRLPMLFGACGLFGGLLLPFLLPHLATLYFSAGLIGMLLHLLYGFGAAPDRLVRQGARAHPQLQSVQPGRRR